MAKSISTINRLRAEAAALFVLAPGLQVVFFDTLGVFAPIAAVCVVAAYLLHRTPDWRWRELVDPRGLTDWLPALAGFTVVAVLAIAGLVLVLRPDDFLILPRERTGLWIAIMTFYPFLSVIGQELVFRPLFFRRYGQLFARDSHALLANAAAFAFAHVFYQNWVALLLTFTGGLAFGYAYQRSGSFPLIFLMHAVAGQAIFTFGLGSYFYHGAIPT